MSKDSSELILSDDLIIEIDGRIHPTDNNLNVIYNKRKKGDFRSFIANLINISDIANNAKKIIKPDLEYAVKFTPELLAKMKTNDIKFLNDKITGDILPVLYDYTEKGFGGQVRLELKGNITCQDVSALSTSFNNLLEQKRYDALIQQVQQIFSTVKRIERGQDTDRFALIISGREKFTQALAIENDDDLRKKLIVEAISTLCDGRKQVELPLMDMLNNLTPVPQNGFLRFIRCFNDEYYNLHTGQYEEIQEYFKYYCMSIEPLAYAYKELNQPQMVETIVNECSDVFNHDKLSYLSTVEPLLNSNEYEKSNFRNAWYNNPEWHKTKLIKSYQLNDTEDMYIKISGSDILEALSDETE